MTTQIETMKTLLANAPTKPKVKFLDPAKASKEIKKAVAKGSTKAKTATTTASQQALAAKIKVLAKRKARLVRRANSRGAGPSSEAMSSQGSFSTGWRTSTERSVLR